MNVVEKYKGRTFAEAAKLIGQKYKDRSTNKASMKAYNLEMSTLANANNVAKMQSEATPEQGNQPIVANNGLQLVPMLGSAASAIRSATATQPTPTLPTLQPPPLSAPSIVDTQVQRRSGLPTLQTVAPEGEPSQMPYYVPALLGGLAQTGAKVAMLMGGYDEATPRNNPNEADVMQTLQGLRTSGDASRDAIASSFNAARRNLTGLSGGQRIANLAALSIAEAVQRANLEQDVTQQRNQLDRIRAFAMEAFGERRANESRRVDLINEQSKGRFQSLVSDTFADVNQLGNTISSMMANRAQNEMMIQSLNSLSTDFGVNISALLDAVTSGDVRRFTQEALVLKEQNPMAYQTLMESILNPQ